MARARCAARPICCAVDGRRGTDVDVVGAGAVAVAAVAAADWPPMRRRHDHRVVDRRIHVVDRRVDGERILQRRAARIEDGAVLRILNGAAAHRDTQNIARRNPDIRPVGPDSRTSATPPCTRRANSMCAG